MIKLEEENFPDCTLGSTVIIITNINNNVLSSQVFVNVSLKIILSNYYTLRKGSTNYRIITY